MFKLTFSYCTASNPEGKEIIQPESKDKKEKSKPEPNEAPEEENLDIKWIYNKEYDWIPAFAGMTSKL